MFMYYTHAYQLLTNILMTGNQRILRQHLNIRVHIGTNDLKSKEPNVVADAIVDLAREIENSCDAEIVLSEITTRNDAHSDAVKTVNRRLKQFSRQNGWKLISHANITQNGLNKGGLHLNREGNDSLHRNFVNFLRNNN